MRKLEEFIRFFFGMIIGLFVGPIIVITMIILAAISDFRGRHDKDVNEIKKL